MTMVEATRDHDLVNLLEVIADEINVQDSVHAVMQSIVAAVIRHTPWTQCWVAMIDTAERRVLHDYGAGFASTYRFAADEWDLEGTLSLEVALTGDVIAVPDVTRSAYPYLDAASAPAGVVATLYLAVPFEQEARSVVLSVSLPYEHEFSAGEISLARGIGTFASIAFRNVLATERVVELQVAEKAKLAELNDTIVRKNASLEELTSAQSRLLRLHAVGADVPMLCAEIADLLKMPTLILDPFHQQIGAHGFSVDDIEAASAAIARRHRSLADSIDPRPLTMVIGDATHVMANVVEDNVVVAVVVLRSGVSGPSASAMRILELARVHVSLMVMRYRAAFESEMRTAREFVDALSSGSSTLTITQHAGLLGLPLQASTQVLLARITGLSEGPGGRRDLDDLCRFVGSRLRRAGYTLIVAPTDAADMMIVLAGTQPRGERVTEPLRRFIDEGVRVTLPSAVIAVAVGIGGPATGVEGLRRSHHEASRALHITLSSGHIDGDLDFEDAGTYAVLAATPADDRRAFVQRYLKPLIDYDRMHGGAFLPTLEMFFESIGNVPRTAERLFLHVSTVRYRLRRIEELAGISLEDEEDRLRLQICLRFLKLTDADR